MSNVLWSIFAHKNFPLFWQWTNKINYVDKLIIKNHMHHVAHKISMNYFLKHKKYKYYVVLSGDDSICFPDSIRMLIEDVEKHKFPIVSGWCCNPEGKGFSGLTIEPCDPTVVKNKQIRRHHYKFIPAVNILTGKYGYPFIKVWFNGLALNLVKRKTVEKIPYRPYMKQRDRLCLTPETRKNGRGVMFDLQFAIDCAKHNIPIIVDTRVFLLHAQTKKYSKVGKEKPEVKFVEATE